MVVVVLDTKCFDLCLDRPRETQTPSKQTAWRTCNSLFESDVSRTRGGPLERKFSEVRKASSDEFLSIIASKTLLVTVRRIPRVITEDPEDDIVLSTAHEGRADHIVSGDKHLLRLREFQGVKIVTVGELLEILRYESEKQSS